MTILEEVLTANEKYATEFGDKGELALRHIVELRSERRFDTAGVASGETRTLSLDWLASYVLRPGTVAYLGYGALLTGPSAHFLETERNSVFAKVSYLWQG